MRNSKIAEILEKLKKLPYEGWRDEISAYTIETLELLATEIYEKSFKEDHLLDRILSERTSKINNNFEWTTENKQKFMNVNDKLMRVFENAYNEALSSAYKLENRIKNNDEFIKDYEIEIEITPYMHEQFYDDLKNNFGFVLSEPKLYNSIIKYSFGHLFYDRVIKETPIYLDKSINWNIEYLENIFKNDDVRYPIHVLFETRKWSFLDIINIDKICADVKITHQYCIENIQGFI